MHGFLQALFHPLFREQVDFLTGAAASQNGCWGRKGASHVFFQRCWGCSSQVGSAGAPRAPPFLSPLDEFHRWPLPFGSESLSGTPQNGQEENRSLEVVWSAPNSFLLPPEPPPAPSVRPVTSGRLQVPLDRPEKRQKKGHLVRRRCATNGEHREDSPRTHRDCSAH